MFHGIDAYFEEFAANRRRIARLLLVVSGVLGTGLFLAGHRLSELASDEIQRFGFEGPKQWVDRIRLEDLDARDSPGFYTITYLTAESRRGGTQHSSQSSHPHAEPVLQKTPGLGDDEFDVIAKARMLALQGPIVRSEELIIETLVRPVYPDEAREKNIEGVVEVLALVDTTGSVLQIQIVGGTREPMVEHAAATAILACRYRPYRVADQARRVWAAYRIAFSLY